MRKPSSKRRHTLVIRSSRLLRVTTLLVLIVTVIIALVGFAGLTAPTPGLGRLAGTAILLASLITAVMTVLLLRFMPVVRCDSNGVTYTRFPARTTGLARQPRSVLVPASAIDHLEIGITRMSDTASASIAMPVFPFGALATIAIACKDGSVVKLPTFIWIRAVSAPDRHPVLRKRIRKMNEILGLSQQP
jgi:hypothetical protein